SLLRVAEVFEQQGAVVEDAGMLRALGDLYARRERYADAEEQYCLAQAICLSSGDAEGEGKALLGLGDLYLRQHQYDPAEENFAWARVAFALALDDEGEAKALDGLISVQGVQGKLGDLRSYCMDACELYGRMGKQMSQICAKNWEMFHSLEALSELQSDIPRLIRETS
ncbi:hypothetical protein FRB90_012659, partial [Tulasnella sp. 427]